MWRQQPEARIQAGRDRVFYTQTPNPATQKSTNSITNERTKVLTAPRRRHQARARWTSIIWMKRAEAEWSNLLHFLGRRGLLGLGKTAREQINTSTHQRMRWCEGKQQMNQVKRSPYAAKSSSILLSYCTKKGSIVFWYTTLAPYTTSTKSD